MTAQDIYGHIANGQLYPIIGRNEKPGREYILFNKNRAVCTLIKQKSTGQITLWVGSKPMPTEHLSSFFESCLKDIGACS